MLNEGVRSPECGLETVAQMPPFPHCRVEVVPSDTVAHVRGCTRMRRKWTFHRRNTGFAGSRCFPGRDEVSGRLGVYIRPDSPVYVWSVTGSLLFGSPLRRVQAYSIMSSGIKLPEVDQAGPAPTTSTRCWVRFWDSHWT